MSFDTLLSDPGVKKAYMRLIRSATLKKDAPTTRICGMHFSRGVRMSRNELPSIFSWTINPKKRRVTEKKEPPLKCKKTRSQPRQNDPVVDINDCEHPEQAVVVSVGKLNTIRKLAKRKLLLKIKLAEQKISKN